MRMHHAHSVIPSLYEFEVSFHYEREDDAKISLLNYTLHGSQSFSPSQFVTVRLNISTSCCLVPPR